MQSLCFDVDGTIINSYDLVSKAYAEVGVTLPDGAWGKSWRDWLIDYCGGSVKQAQYLHQCKVEAYSDLIMRTDLRQYELPAARLARLSLLRHGPSSVSYLTAGTPETAFAIVSRLAIASRLRGGLTYSERAVLLAALPAGSVYLDDNLDTLTRLAVDVPTVRLVAITGQSLDELIYEVERVQSERV